MHDAIGGQQTAEGVLPVSTVALYDRWRDGQQQRCVIVGCGCVGGDG